MKKDGSVKEASGCAAALLNKQRSHVLFVFSNPQAGAESAFLNWYRSRYSTEVASSAGVLGSQYYSKHDVDVTRGKYQAIPYDYLAVHMLSLDGAEEAAVQIDRITALHAEQPTAKAPVTWLYYPASEKVGRAPAANPAPLVIAFANGLPGQENEFREWYATRHIRHALKVPAIVSGQCFERAQYQAPGALEATFATIAIYEQEGAAEDVLQGLVNLPAGALRFPMMDFSRFSEWAYRPLLDA